MKKLFLKIIIILISFLGFSGCGEEVRPDLYGPVPLYGVEVSCEVDDDCILRLSEGWYCDKDENICKLDPAE